MTVRQFDVCHLRGGGSKAPSRLVVVLQHDVLDHLNTRVVAPLLDVGDEFALRDAVIMTHVAGRRYAVAVQLMSAVSLAELGPAIANIDARQPALARAIDLLFLGF